MEVYHACKSNQHNNVEFHADHEYSDSVLMNTALATDSVLG